MATLSLRRLSLLTVIAAAGAAAAARASGPLVPFLIPGAAENEETRMVTAQLPELTCLFTWQNERPAEPPVQNATDLPRQRADAQALLSSLKGDCVSTPSVDMLGGGGFSYTVCIGTNVRQGVGESSFLVGTFDDAGSATIPPHIQHFSGGQACGSTARSAHVAFGCSQLASVLSPSEPSTCYYELRVVHPALCASPLFPVVGSAAPTQRSSPSPRPVVAVAAAAAAAAAPADVAAGRTTARRKAGGAVRGLRDRSVGSKSAAAASGSGPSARDAAEADLPGTGGLSMGIDDSLRGGVAWAGAPASHLQHEAIAFFSRLDTAVAAATAAGPAGRSTAAPSTRPPAALPEKQSTWTLEMHHAFAPAAASRGGGRARGSDTSGGTAAAPLSVQALCTVTMTDDLRKGMEVKQAIEGSRPGPLASFSVALLAGGSDAMDADVVSGAAASDAAAAISAVRVGRVAARAPNRRLLDVQVIPNLEHGAALQAHHADVLVVAERKAARSACEVVGLPAEVASRCLVIATSGVGDGSGGGVSIPPTLASSAMEFLSLSAEVWQA